MKKSLTALLTVSAGMAGLMIVPTSVKACTTLLVEKDATSDSSTIIARNENLQTS